MRAVLEPSIIRGSLRAPRSKSHAIRLILSSMIAPTRITGVPSCDDVHAAIRLVESLGVRVRVEGDKVVLEPPLDTPKSARVNVGGSATTLRMAIAIASVLGVELEVDGDETLRRRPLDAIVDALADRGVRVSGRRLPVRVSGRLRDSYVEVRGDESSQYISGFMIAFCMLGEGEVSIIPPLVSRSYVRMTGDVLRLYGCRAEISDTRVRVYRVHEAGEVAERVWGDYALASFYAASALATGGYVRLEDLPRPLDYFGDHSIVEIYDRMGAVSVYRDGVWILEARESYKPVSLDFEDAPDLPLSVAPLAALAEGCSELRGVSRLRIKESDRVDAVISVLRAFGALAVYESGSIRVCRGESELSTPPVVSSRGDHRVAMMAAVLALRSGGVVENAEAVNKSNPLFWRDIASIGGRVRLE